MSAGNQGGRSVDQSCRWIPLTRPSATLSPPKGEDRVSGLRNQALRGGGNFAPAEKPITPMRLVAMRLRWRGAPGGGRVAYRRAWSSTVGGVGFARERCASTNAAMPRSRSQRDVMAFVVGPLAMSPTRRNNHCAARGLVRCGEIGEAGFVDVGDDAFATVGNADFHFASLAFRARRAIGPEEDFFARFNRRARWSIEQRCECLVLQIVVGTPRCGVSVGPAVSPTSRKRPGSFRLFVHNNSGVTWLVT
jgi:hypothetical protein